MAKVKLTPVEPLEIEFADGTTKTAIYNNEAFAIFNEEFGSLEELALSEGQEKPYDFCSKLLYAGVKVTDKTITLDDAKAMAYMGGVELLTAIMDTVVQNITAGMDDGKKENFYKEVNSRVLKLMAQA